MISRVLLPISSKEGCDAVGSATAADVLYSCRSMLPDPSWPYSPRHEALLEVAAEVNARGHARPPGARHGFGMIWQGFMDS